ncbi:phage portal protein [Kineosporia sp. R_H_3]|uniref:phage portal protein n=1 Tax=Kineosporia sp. R_H_3 TaxID=1961848 RepID=UPI000B4B335E|nr:phage portal protein [Kineosporia sp. R_H_3]
MPAPNADPGSPLWWLIRLKEQHKNEVPALERYNAHYEGTQPLSYLASELVTQLSDRLRQVVIAWPMLVVDSVEERLDIEGFRLANSTSANDELWDIWQANDLDEWSQQAHLDALVMKRSYAIVGTNGEDARRPIITVESPLQVIHERDPRTRKVAAAAKFWTDDEGQQRATLYLPNETSWWVGAGSGWEQGSDDPDEHGRGVVPVEPIVNRPRLRAMNGAKVMQAGALAAVGEGTSDLAPVIPISDAACKVATDMMVAAEFHAMPRRWALGFSREDFEDEAGNKISPFRQIAGNIWASERTKQEGAEVGQFPESNLSNFHETLKLLAQITGQVSGLPAHYLNFATDNPASADAIRSGEVRLVKRAERKQRSFGGSWERVMRLALLWRDNSVPAEASRMETIWRDASTPTIAQVADAAVKKNQAGIVPLRQTREDLGYSATQIDRMQEEDERTSALAFGLTPPPKPVPATSPGEMSDDGDLEPADPAPGEGDGPSD